MKLLDLFSDQRNADPEATLITSDVLDGLDQVKDETVRLAITSPPYNLRKVYEQDIKRSLGNYIRDNGTAKRHILKPFTYG
jgi:DNA modification methylase